MRLTQLAAKPKLIKIELTDEDIIKEYGEPIEFWIYDRQSMAKFIKLANSSEENYTAMVETVESMILDEEGKEILRDGLILPIPIMSKVVTRVVETLGK
jgi:hypothetical protein